MMPAKITIQLNARVYGEWLAALGLLRIADSVCPHSALCFDENDYAILTTDANERALVRRIAKSANQGSVTVRFYTPARTHNGSTVRIGDKLFSSTECSLDDKSRFPDLFENKDAKAGFVIRLEAVRRLEISHVLGEAMADCAGLKSPLRFWSGNITLPRILQQLTAFVARQFGLSLNELLSKSLHATQRLRFDNTGEQFAEDGGHDVTLGRTTRPAVEWLGLIGLSFYPPEAGFKALLEDPRHLRAAVWHRPLTANALSLALHCGQFPEFHTFAIISDGRIHKLRLAGTAQKD